MSRVPAAPLAGRRRELARARAPVVDPRSLLGAERTPLPSSARLLVLAVDGVEAGMLVEAVTGLLEPVPPTPDRRPRPSSRRQPRCSGRRRRTRPARSSLLDPRAAARPARRSCRPPRDPADQATATPIAWTAVQVRRRRPMRRAGSCRSVREGTSVDVSKRLAVAAGATMWGGVVFAVVAAVLTGPVLTSRSSTGSAAVAWTVAGAALAARDHVLSATACAASGRAADAAASRQILLLVEVVYITGLVGRHRRAATAAAACC